MEFYEIKNNFILGDCMEYMSRIPDNYFELAIVDPPYGIDIAKNGSLGANKFAKKNWDEGTPTKKYFDQLKRVSVEQIVWGWNYMTDKLPASKAFIYWNKLNHHDNRSDGELAYYSGNGLARHFEYMWDGNRFGFKNGKINGVGRPSIRIHPTQKPKALYRWLIENYANPGDRIIDTHVGSGNSLAVYEETGNPYLGFEIDADYYRDACANIAKHKAFFKERSENEIKLAGGQKSIYDEI